MKVMALMAALCAAPAAAQDACIQRGEMQQRIEQDFGEVSVGYGMRVDRVVMGTGPETVIEVWVSQSGTWTITETRSDGMSCAVAYGDSWVFVEQPWPQVGELN